MLIIIQFVSTIANILCMIWQYEEENYKTAILNGFAAGICLMGFIVALSN